MESRSSSAADADGLGTVDTDQARHGGYRPGLIRSSAVCAIATAVSLLFWVTPAGAKTLGGLRSATLYAIDRTVGIVTPTVVGCDYFRAATNTNLNGYTSACGNTWQSNSGNWSIMPDGASSDQPKTAPLATLNTNVQNATISVDMTGFATSDVNRSGGLVGSFSPADTTGPFTYIAAVMTAGSPATLALRLVVAGVSTTIASTSVVVTTTSSHLVLSRNNSSVTVSVDGIQRIAATLTSAQVTALGSGGRSGLIGGSNAVRFFNFSVSSP